MNRVAQIHASALRRFFFQQKHIRNAASATIQKREIHRHKSHPISRKKRVERGTGRLFFVRVFFRICFACRIGIFSSHKMLAEIRALFFLYQIFDAFAAVKMISQRIEFASPATMQVRAANRTSGIPVNAFGQIHFFATFPTHIFIVNV